MPILITGLKCSTCFTLGMRVMTTWTCQHSRRTLKTPDWRYWEYQIHRRSFYKVQVHITLAMVILHQIKQNIGFLHGYHTVLALISVFGTSSSYRFLSEFRKFRLIAAVVVRLLLTGLVAGTKSLTKHGIIFHRKIR